MIVVSDTTPLISLLKIERLDLLKKLFENVLIPQAVYEEHELTSDEVKECVSGLQRAGRPYWTEALSDAVGYVGRLDS